MILFNGQIISSKENNEKRGNFFGSIKCTDNLVTTTIKKPNSRDLTLTLMKCFKN